MHIQFGYRPSVTSSVTIHVTWLSRDVSIIIHYWMRPKIIISLHAHAKWRVEDVKTEKYEWRDERNRKLRKCRDKRGNRFVSIHHRTKMKKKPQNEIKNSNAREHHKNIWSICIRYISYIYAHRNTSASIIVQAERALLWARVWRIARIEFLFLRAHNDIDDCRARVAEYCQPNIEWVYVSRLESRLCAHV